MIRFILTTLRDVNPRSRGRPAGPPSAPRVNASAALAPILTLGSDISLLTLGSDISF